MFHKWIGEDENLVRCLTCGGAWYSHGMSASGTVMTTGIDGEDPTDCQGLVDQCHHYKMECPKTDDQACTRQDCNCLHCDS